MYPLQPKHETRATRHTHGNANGRTVQLYDPNATVVNEK